MQLWLQVAPGALQTPECTATRPSQVAAASPSTPAAQGGITVTLWKIPAAPFAANPLVLLRALRLARPGPQPHCPVSQPQTSVSHQESETVFKHQPPASDIFYNEMGSTWTFATRCKQLTLPTAWPFIVANLHVCIANNAVPGCSVMRFSAIARPARSAADTFSRLQDLLWLINLTTGASRFIHQLTCSSQSMFSAIKQFVIVLKVPPGEVS